MPIAQVNVDDPITAAKINEIIDALNAIGISWINFDGNGGVTVRGSAGNIAGVTRVTAGLYRINFTTPAANTNYMTVASCSINIGNDTGFVQITDVQTTYVEINCRNDDGGANDCSIICALIIGN